MKVKVENFQAVKSAELEIEGFTVVTGPSNWGKSALLRAITGALFGMDGTHYIRDGANSCQVEVEDADFKVAWTKARHRTTKVQSGLVVNGQTHTAIGKTHADLTASLGFREVKAGDATLLPQVARQHDDLFLLGAGPTAAADVFKLLGRVDVVTRAQTAAGRDLRQVKAEHGIRAGDRDRAQEDLNGLAWVPAQRVAFDALLGALGAQDELFEQALGRAGDVDELRGLAPVVLPEEPELPNPTVPAGAARKIEELIELRPVTLPAEPHLPDPTIPAGLARKVVTLGTLAPLLLPDEPTLPGPGREPELMLQIEALQSADHEAADARYGLDSAWLDEADQAAHVKDLEELMDACPTCERAFERDS